MTVLFRCRVDKELLEQARGVAGEIGAECSVLVNLMFKQLVKRRTVPFPLLADLRLARSYPWLPGVPPCGTRCIEASPQPGEVWTVDFGIAAKPCRVLVVSIPATDCRLAIASVVQLTTQNHGTPYEVALPRVPWLQVQSYVNAQSVQPVKWTGFGTRFGQLDAAVVEAVRKALGLWLGI